MKEKERPVYFTIAQIKEAIATMRKLYPGEYIFVRAEYNYRISNGVFHKLVTYHEHGEHRHFLNFEDFLAWKELHVK